MGERTAVDAKVPARVQLGDNTVRDVDTSGVVQARGVRPGSARVYREITGAIRSGSGHVQENRLGVRTDPATTSRRELQYSAGEDEA